MKIYPLLILSLFLFAGCHVTYMQVYNTDTFNTQKTDNTFVFENDSLKITYSFWSNGGAMSFSVFNKLTTPLYIDWRRSSCIVNSKNSFYAEDSLVSEATTSHSYDYYYKNYIPVSSHTTTTHQKYISFIPPRSIAEKSLPFIVRKYISLPPVTDVSIRVRNDSRRKKTKIYDYKYDGQNSPVVFRNYLTLSYDEDFQKTFSVDNGFYVSQIQAMDIDNFRTVYGDSTIKYYYKKGTDFYLVK